jgi:effector-binding domain-containing protein
MSTQTPSRPEIVERAEQPYVAMAGSVTMTTFSDIADRLPELLGWLTARGIEPAGPPFFKYDLIDMHRELRIEAGFPVASPVPGEEPVRPGVLPAGRYATVTHIGHPDRLVDINAALLAWADERGLRWDMSETDAGQRWGCRLEVYKTDPRVEPDPSKWEVELAFRLAD